MGGLDDVLEVVMYNSFEQNNERRGSNEECIYIYINIYIYSVFICVQKASVDGLQGDHLDFASIVCESVLTIVQEADRATV